MPRPQITRAHLITGGFPPGTAAGHDMNYARLRLLGIPGTEPCDLHDGKQRLWRRGAMATGNPDADHLRRGPVS